MEILAYLHGTNNCAPGRDLGLQNYAGFGIGLDGVYT